MSLSQQFSVRFGATSTFTEIRLGECASYTSTLINRKSVGAPRTVRTPENVERVRRALIRSLKYSAWRHSIELVTGKRSIRRILHEDTYFRPYKLIIGPQLKPWDYTQRLNFALPTEAIFEANDILILLTNDECSFTSWWHGVVIGILNTRDHCTVRPKVTVWYAVGKTTTIAPYILKTIMEMLLLWIPSDTSTYKTSLCLNYDEIVCLFDAYSAEWHDGPPSQNTNGHSLPSLPWSPHFHVCWHFFPPRCPYLSTYDFFREQKFQSMYVCA